jgi:precorrin-3B synthase
MTSAAPLFRSADDQPVASTRRGVCPSLAKPMRTGDGLLVRLRPASGGVSPEVLARIAEAARINGNGILEVTARGNLQIRGLREETVAPLTEAVFATGIDLATGLAVETPPLSGVDPSEICDPRPLAARIRTAVAQEAVPLVLAAKLSVIVDGGGVFHLDGVVADIRLKAVRTGEGVAWALALGGTGRTARPVALFGDDAALDAVMHVLRRLHATGNGARGKDLDITGLGLVGLPLPEMIPGEGVRRPAGVHDLGEGGHVAGFGLPFFQVSAENLVALAEAAARFGVEDIRLAPEHGLLVPGLDRERAEALLDEGRRLGFRVSPDDPANAIALCAGTAGCASAYYDTHALAEVFIERAPELLDGSFELHLSGCAKGCAHPASALLTIPGASLGYGLVVNGSASASPAAYIAANDVASAAARLGLLVRTEKQAGETARACLTRLGAERIAAALQQEE